MQSLCNPVEHNSLEGYCYLNVIFKNIFSQKLCVLAVCDERLLIYHWEWKGFDAVPTDINKLITFKLQRYC